MTKQTPERFAKTMLWQLAGIRAAIDQLQSNQIAQTSILTGVPPIRIRKVVAAEILRAQKKLFAEMAESSELH